MFSFIAFIFFIVLTVFFYIWNRFIRKSTNHFDKKVVISALIVVGIFALGSILPYMLQQHDKSMIDFHTKNLTLLDSYTQEYTQAAQDQIAEYQKMVSEMARTATSTQLQFYNQQIDAVGNELSAKIKEFKNDKMAQQIEINRFQAAVETRVQNKWFFWIK
jgi:hypothetical protein